ncbi:hypothetical protein R1sor_018028 [Riccia sorocarpa]|uniref:Endonuclease/exonuclease/phosphatase domain-containing protein n=1 Tax=Riccia sorocarpa TaxID=122646 RepID=A0ABD3I9L9_9MARC
MDQLMSGMDIKLRTYVDTAREAQSAALRDHEQEVGARRARSCNLHISGLEEAEGEDTLERVSTFFREVLKVASPRIEQVHRLGKPGQGIRPILVVAGNIESWQGYDLLAFVETWDARETSEVTIEGFSCLVALWNAKTRKKGGGFGGISIWFREGLNLKLQVEYTDKMKQFLCIEVSDSNSRSLLFFSYFAPAGAPLYSRSTGDGNPYLALSRIVLRYRELGKLWLFGDFNARTSNSQSELLEGIDGTNPIVNQWPRTSMDTGRNLFTDYFLQFTAICGLTIINGTSRFPNSGGFTYHSERGASVVDYCLSSDLARDSVKDFSVGILLPESDHTPLSCILSDIYSVIKPGRRKGVSRGLLLDKTLQDEYAQTLTRELAGVTVSADELPGALIRTARAVFCKKRVGRQIWFDESCLTARHEALAQPLEVRHTAYRSYRNLIRAKKR